MALSEREQFTLRAFAAALSTAIRNASAFAETKRLAAEHEHAAKHDPLTGLANRRQLYTVGDDFLAERSAEGQIGLLLMDLNHFKEVFIKSSPAVLPRARWKTCGARAALL